MLAPLMAQILLWSQGREPPDRDLDSVELLSGEMAITNAMLAQGRRSVGFDKRYGPDEDLCSTAGFDNAINLILRIKPHGALELGRPCLLQLGLHWSQSDRALGLESSWEPRIAEHGRSQPHGRCALHDVPDGIRSVSAHLH